MFFRDFGDGFGGENKRKQKNLDIHTNEWHVDIDEISALSSFLIVIREDV